MSVGRGRVGRAQDEEDIRGVAEREIEHYQEKAPIFRSGSGDAEGGGRAGPRPVSFTKQQQHADGGNEGSDEDGAVILAERSKQGEGGKRPNHRAYLVSGAVEAERAAADAFFG